MSGQNDLRYRLKQALIELQLARAKLKAHRSGSAWTTRLTIAQLNGRTRDAERLMLELVDEQCS